MRILLDMNLSPRWCEILVDAGHECAHWSAVGSYSAPDEEVLKWARDHDHVLMTHDLDFGAILAATQWQAPSVVQFRIQDIMPANAAGLVLAILGQYENALTRGALITVDAARERVRILPLRREEAGPEVR